MGSLAAHHAEGALTPVDLGVLADLYEAGALTAEQVHRLRFPATTLANCRLRLSRLARRGLLARMDLRGGAARAARWWYVTERGAAALGRPRAPRAAGDEPPLEDEALMGWLVGEAERFVQRALAERVPSR